MNKNHYSKFTTGVIFSSIVYTSTLFFVAVKNYFSGDDSIQYISIMLPWTLLSGIIVVPVITWILVRCFPIYVKNEGLRSYNIYCFYKDIYWDDIGAIKPINILGLRYIRVKSKIGGTPIWIPVWLKDIDGFLSAIEHYGGDKSLFQKYFEKNS